MNRSMSTWVDGLAVKNIDQHHIGRLAGANVVSGQGSPPRCSDRTLLQRRALWRYLDIA